MHAYKNEIETIAFFKPCEQNVNMMEEFDIQALKVCLLKYEAILSNLEHI